MNEVLKNVEFLVKILAMSKTDCVEEWDEDALLKSLKWAKYFEQVYFKIKSKEHLIQQLEKKINSTIEEHHLCLGLSGFNVHSLKSAKKSLIINLIQNKKVPSPVFNLLMKEFKNEQGEYSQELFEDTMHSVSREKLLVWPILKSIKSKSCEELQDGMDRLEHAGPRKEHDTYQSKHQKKEEVANWNDTGYQIRSRTCGRILRKCIQQQLMTGKSQTSKELQTKLQVLADSLGGQICILCSTVLQCDIPGSETVSSGKSENVSDKEVTDFIMGFIQEDLTKKWTVHRKEFLQLPPQLLTQVCSTHREVIPIYVRQLFTIYKILFKKDRENDLSLLVRMNQGASSEDNDLNLVKSHLNNMAKCAEFRKDDLIPITNDFMDKKSDSLELETMQMMQEWDQLISGTKS